MNKVTETQLPGVGVRHNFTTDSGVPVGVLAHRGGRRELLVYERSDPDACSAVVQLSPDDSHVLAELLGASQVSEAVHEVQQQIDGLAIEWFTLPAGSPFLGMTIGQGAFRSRTGASIVAVLRGVTTFPAPGADFAFEGGDVAVAVGTSHGLEELQHLLQT